MNLNFARDRIMVSQPWLFLARVASCWNETDFNVIGSPSNLDSKSVLEKSDPLSYQEQGTEAYSGDGKFIKKNFVLAVCRGFGWWIALTRSEILFKPICLIIGAASYWIFTRSLIELWLQKWSKCKTLKKKSAEFLKSVNQTIWWLFGSSLTIFALCTYFVNN